MPRRVQRALGGRLAGWSWVPWEGAPEGAGRAGRAAARMVQGALGGRSGGVQGAARGRPGGGADSPGRVPRGGAGCPGRTPGGGLEDVKSMLCALQRIASPRGDVVI